jgi:hypothetical protein
MTGAQLKDDEVVVRRDGVPMMDNCFADAEG